MLGIELNIVSNSSLINFCFLESSSILIEISFDFENRDLSLDLEIVFFSISNCSFSWIKDRLSLSRLSIC